MKISLEFNSMDEIIDFMKRTNISLAQVCTDAPVNTKELNETAMAATEIINRAEEKAEETPKETPQEPQEEQKAEEPKKDVEKLHVAARKALSKVNKALGKGTAKGWISELGFSSLSEIEDPDILESLIKKAEETDA